ncbi:hypothetical protein ACUXPG_002399 [Staphylococcus hominis]
MDINNLYTYKATCTNVVDGDTLEYVLRHNQLKQTSILDPRELSIKEMMWELKYDLQRMDELDGTNDFKNLLSDLEEQ